LTETAIEQMSAPRGRAAWWSPRLGGGRQPRRLS